MEQLQDQWEQLMFVTRETFGFSEKIAIRIKK
jgi:BMFP domain-containing protein YqiC